jgi:hypothetical protein
MNQPALFHESINDALRELVAALGGMKQVGTRLRPELSADHAGRWLSDCMNPDRREHITPEQVMWLLAAGRKASLHGTIGWIATEAGYQAPAPIEPLDERAALQREFVEATKRQEQLLSRMERLAGAQASSSMRIVA